MDVYVYICIHAYAQTLVNVYINMYLYNTYIYTSTYIHICIYTYCCSEFVVVHGVSLVSPGSTVCVLLVLQCVLQSVLECVLQGVLQRGAVCCKSGVAVFVAGCRRV